MVRLWDLHDVVFLAVGEGRRCRWHGLVAGGRVAFVPEVRGGREDRVARHVVDVEVVELALGGDVVLDGQDAGEGDGRAEAHAVGEGRDLGVRGIELLLCDGADGVEWFQEFLRFRGGAGVEEAPVEDGVGRADGRVHDDGPVVDAHFRGRGAVRALVERVERFEDGFELVLRPDVAVVVPGVDFLGVDFLDDAGDDGEVVACAFEAPEEVWMAGLVHAELGSVCQDDVVMRYTVHRHSVESGVAPVATAEGGAKNADTGRCSGSWVNRCQLLNFREWEIHGVRTGNIARVPERWYKIARECSALNQSSLIFGVNLYTVELIQVDLYTREGRQGIRDAMTPVSDQKFEAVFIAVCDLRW